MSRLKEYPDPGGADNIDMPRLQLQWPERFGFETLLQIYISHVNQGGHLDNAQLLTLVSEARVRFFQSLGYREGDVGGCPIVVAELQAQYLSEGFHGETLRLAMQPVEFTRCGFALAFQMSDATSQRLVARGQTGIVFIDRTSRRPVPIPVAVRAQLEAV